MVLFCPRRLRIVWWVDAGGSVFFDWSVFFSVKASNFCVALLVVEVAVLVVVVVDVFAVVVVVDTISFSFLTVVDDLRPIFKKTILVVTN